MSKILIIDDDLEICSLVKRALEKEGHQVTIQPDPIQAETMPLDLFDLILLDVMMPGKDGFTLCRDIRERVDCPILFLTAKTEECDLMQGLGNGGDDYITKPFGIGELRARVAAHLRRETREKKHRMSVGAFQFELGAKKMFCREEEIPLTKSEYTICEYLALN